MSGPDDNGKVVRGAFPLAARVTVAPGRNGGATAHAAEPDGELLARTQCWLRELADENELNALKAEAAQDGHMVIAPTHVVEKNGEIIGYASVAAVAMVNVWIHSRKAQARDSLAMLNMAENEAARRGFKVICVPCARQSPFRALMNKFGYRYLMESGFFLKALRKALR